MDITVKGVNWNVDYVRSFTSEAKFIKVNGNHYWQDIDEAKRKEYLKEVYKQGNPKKKPATDKA